MTSPLMHALGRIDYGGRRFRPVSPRTEAGTPTPDTTPAAVGQYHQDGDLIWAEFTGATVRVGRLVGVCGPDGVIDAAYCLVTTEGETLAGACTSTPTVLADGRLSLTEHWRRMDGSSGVSYLEEVTQREVTQLEVTQRDVT